MNRILIIFIIVILSLKVTYAQERVVKIDFESGNFYNNPKIPFDKPLGIVGEAEQNVEFVKVNVFFEGKSFILHSFNWNRFENNSSETFKIVIPPILKSSTKYDFEIVTYKLLTKPQKVELLKNVEDRVRFLFSSNIYYDGKSVVINNPKDIYSQLDLLLKSSFQYYESKNLIPIQSPSTLVLKELKNQSNFKFRKFFKKEADVEKNEAVKKLIDKKVEHLVQLVLSELKPFTNSQLVQHYRQVNVKSVETDKEPFSLPVNIGMYSWSKSANINNTTMQSINFTPGAGLTIPFSNKSRLTSQTRIFDSFGVSLGVLFQPITDVSGAEFVTPGINLPMYTALGFRLFKVVRFNAGVLVLGETGTQNFDKITVIPTIGIALELNLWMGIKK